MSNTSWVQLIKQIAKEERVAAKLCDVCIGTISSIVPLTISISQVLTIDESFFSVASRIRELVQKDLLHVGDKVLMLRQSGGQNYVVMDKV